MNVLTRLDNDVTLPARSAWPIATVRSTHPEPDNRDQNPPIKGPKTAPSSSSPFRHFRSQCSLALALSLATDFPSLQLVLPHRSHHHAFHRVAVAHGCHSLFPDCHFAQSIVALLPLVDRTARDFDLEALCRKRVVSWRVVIPGSRGWGDAVEYQRRRILCAGEG